MKYLSLNYDNVAEAIRSQIDSEEVQRITLTEDNYSIELILDKYLGRAHGDLVWQCNVVSANLFTLDGELISSQLFDMDELNLKIGLVKTTLVFI
jgi:hypothetical protein